ncbi:MAG: hypothetical protein HGA75_03195 [Thiobacillus sp.]|nr:hypothetical protein [Thiobacillus sp.]
MKRTTRSLAAGLALLGAAAPASAVEMQWQDNDLTYVAGGRFKVLPEHQQTLTFEHASGWRFDGFIDWNIDSDGRYASNWHFNPQLKYDLGKSFGWHDRALQVGFEYSYWKNKFGIRDSQGFRTNESALSVIAQAHF